MRAHRFTESVLSMVFLKIKLSSNIPKLSSNHYLGKQENVAIMLTTSSLCTLMADGLRVAQPIRLHYLHY